MAQAALAVIYRKCGSRASALRPKLIGWDLCAVVLSLENAKSASNGLNLDALPFEIQDRLARVHAMIGHLKPPLRDVEYEPRIVSGTRQAGFLIAGLNYVPNGREIH